MWKKANPADIQQVKTIDGKTYGVKHINGQLYLEELTQEQPPQQPQPLMQEFQGNPEGRGIDKKHEDERGQGKSAVKPPRLTDNAFRARISSIMTDNKYDRVLRGRTRGALDMGRLPKVATGSTSIFKRKEARKNKHYNIIFLVDLSGSMEGRKARVAAEATTYLLNNFEGLNINTEVLGFTEYGHVIKAFDDPYTKDTDQYVFDTISNQRIHGGGNYDYDAMAWAYSRFPRNNGHNVLVMLSDGAPCGGEPTYPIYERASDDSPKNWERVKEFKVPAPLDSYEKEQEEHLHNLVKRHERDVDSIGVGILEGGWQIPDHEVINNIDELKGTMVQMLRKKVKRG